MTASANMRGLNTFYDCQQAQVLEHRAAVCFAVAAGLSLLVFGLLLEVVQSKLLKCFNVGGDPAPFTPSLALVTREWEYRYHTTVLVLKLIVAGAGFVGAIFWILSIDRQEECFANVWVDTGQT